MSSDRKTWNIKSSRTAQQAHNPLRAIVDKLKVDPNATKPLISLSIGKHNRIDARVSVCKHILTFLCMQVIPLFLAILTLIPVLMKLLRSN
jgi:hypothetical protein